MKTIIAALLLTSFNVFASDVVIISKGTFAGIALTTFSPFTLGDMTATTETMEKVAIAIENDSLEYFQNGQMSLRLEDCVNKIMDQNNELSIEEAISVALEFAHYYSK